MQDTYEVIKKHKWKIIISFALAFFLIFAMSVIIGLNDIINVLNKANWRLVLLNFVLEALIILVWTLRWKIILDVVDKSPRFRSLVVLMMASLFGNNITPGAAGGEPLRAYLLTVKGTPFELGFASSTADRVFEFFPFMLISIFAAFLILTWSISIWTKIIVSVLIFFSLLIFGILIYTGLNRSLAIKIIISLAKSVFPFFIRLTRKNITFNEVREKLVFYVTRFSSGFMEVLKDKKVFIIGFILSFSMWGLDIVRIYICFASLGTFPPWSELIIIYTVAIFISLLPLLPGAWGIREATLIALFAVIGVGADVVISASLIDRIASYIVPTLIGAVAAVYYSKHLRAKKKIRSETSPRL